MVDDFHEVENLKNKCIIEIILVGWNDAEFEDDETFKDILRFIDGNYMTSIKGFKIIQPHSFKNSTFDIISFCKIMYL